MSRKFRAAFRRTVCCWVPCDGGGRAPQAPAQAAVEAPAGARPHIVVHRRPGYANPAAGDRSAKTERPQRKVYFFISFFYRATLCYGVFAMVLYPSVSVCLSQVGVLLKRLNMGSHKQHHSPHDSRGTLVF